MIRVLIVENSTAAALEAKKAMAEMGYEAVSVPGLKEALDTMAHIHCDIIIAGVASDACELCSELRAAGDSTPLLAIIDGTNRPNRRRAFRSGADGYLSSPYDTEELQMYVKNLLWRCRIEDDAELDFGDCRLLAGKLCLETPDGTIELRRMEFLLLEKLLSYPGRVFTRAQLMDDLWGYDTESDPRTVDTHIRRLRKKLKDVDSIRLQTVRGLGYRAALPRRTRGQNGA